MDIYRNSSNADRDPYQIAKNRMKILSDIYKSTQSSDYLNSNSSDLKQRYKVEQNLELPQENILNVIQDHANMISDNLNIANKAKKKL